jgi:hypothetical protein
VIFAVVVVATLLQPTGEFRYDARGYWAAAGSLVGATEPVPDGFWDLRGVLSSVVFVPAQLVSGALGPASAGFAVLVQNAVVIAAVATFLLPALVRPWVSLSFASRAAGALALALATRGFAPYPLVDLYAAIALLGAVTLLYRRSLLALLTAGALIGVAVNIRPAYLLPSALLAVVVVLHRRVRALLVAAGALVALLPQVVYGAVVHGTFGVMPAGSAALVGLQTSYASYTVRYDTAVTAHLPQQFFCSPGMAAGMQELPTTATDLVRTFLTELPGSAVFALEKVGAALHWPLSVPYLVPAPGVNAVFAVLITAVCVFGIARLVGGRPSPTAGTGARTLVAVVAVASVATLVSSATEARFALPLVLLGAAGITVLVERPLAPRASRWDQVLSAVALLVTVALLVLGWTGLSHPAPPGDVTPEICASETRP